MPARIQKNNGGSVASTANKLSMYLHNMVSLASLLHQRDDDGAATTAVNAASTTNGNDNNGYNSNRYSR